MTIVYNGGMRKVLACAGLASLLTIAPLAAQKSEKDLPQDPKRPKITLKAQPVIAMSPARIVLTAELVGGPNDYEEFYCPAVEWDWGDGTQSESTTDCQPYEAGKSEIKRHFTTDHTYNIAGEYRVEFRLKQKDKVVARASTDVKVRPGVRDGGGFDR